MLEQLGYYRVDLVKVVGRNCRAREIFNKMGKLSLEMIRQIHTELNISTEVSIQSY